VLVVTDPGVAATGSPQRVADQMTGFGIEAVVFDGSHVEPTDASLQMTQQRLLATAPKDVTEDDGAGIFTCSLSLW
jgi:alcohol dehydrogenase class IV